MFLGAVPGTLLSTSHAAIQFMVYEELKRLLSPPSTPSSSSSSSNPPPTISLGFVSMPAAGVSKFIAALVTYPLQVVRVRLQVRPDEPVFAQYKGVLDVFSKIKQLEGFRGFYRGFFVHLTRSVPANAVNIVVYEYIKAFLASPPLT
jgi:hypothetical protein